MQTKERRVLIGSERVNAVAAVALTALGTVAGCGSSSEVTRNFWFVGPPRQFRVNSPDAAQGPYSDRWEAQQDGRMVLRVDDDLRNVARAWLCLELWGGHPGVAAKRVTVNGRTTYALPEVGAAEGHCTYSYPQIELRLDDLVPGDNVLEFSCDKGTAFWGHYIVRAAGIRLELRRSHPLASAAPRGCAVRCERDGEVMRLGLDVPDDQRSRIARVVYRGRYRGYDENGDGAGDDWHGVTLDGQAVDCIGASSEPPFSVAWDVRMVPDQASVEVQADVYVVGHEGVVCRTPSLPVPMPSRASRVVMLNATRLPRPFWSRASKRKECDIEVPFHPAEVERAVLHIFVWDGGKGGIDKPLSVNSQAIWTPDWLGRHAPIHSVLDVPPAWLAEGRNTVSLLSDTEHHGIEVCLPGPALVVRLKPTASRPTSGPSGLELKR
jgi:hypothetical protein